MMKKLTILTLIFITTIAAQAQTNFKGTWKRNAGKTELSETVSINSVPTQLEVSQDNKGINIKRNSITSAGDAFSYIEKLKFDDTEVITVVKYGVNKKGTLKWSDDKLSFTETALFTNDEGKQFQKTIETWGLSADGKTLTISRTDEIDGEKTDLKEIFDKQ